MSLFSYELSQLSEHLQNDPSISGLLLTGQEGIAPAILEVMIVVSDEEFEKRLQSGCLHYKATGMSEEAQGKIHGKYISPAYMEKVARFGSEPARFAFMGAVIVFSRLPELRTMINEITEYPLHQKQANINRFYAQFEAWYQECRQALQSGEYYVLHQSITNMILFSGRLILAHNEMLYPGHKSLIHMLKYARKKPEYLLKNMQQLMTTPTEISLERIYRQMREYHSWVNEDLNWTDYVLLDSELQWMRQSVSVSEI